MIDKETFPLQHMNVTKDEPTTSAQTAKFKQPSKATISKTHLWAEMDVKGSIESQKKLTNSLSTNVPRVR